MEKLKKKFNWGAFLLGWIWGIFNKSWITLIQLPLGFIPKYGIFASLLCAIWFGIKGNEWSVKNKGFEDADKFNEFQKKFIYAWIILTAIGLFIYLFIPYLDYSGAQYIKQGDYKKAAKNYEILAKTTQRPDYYYTLGNCYIELKNIDKAIEAYKKTPADIDNYRLVDLFIIKEDYDNAVLYGGEYKVCALKEDWACVLDATDSKIMLGKADYMVYLARAIANKNLNNTINAQKDLLTAQRINPGIKDEILKAYNNKNYFKQYYEEMKKALQ